ncbi:MAG: DUF4956 domain-containing protein [Saprospiraceae bacterium]|jgi:uncharacterized membrane protein YhiD involved in acid resistance|nr:DUF4956 domain-containing protein [Saprospiraceae bacterium]
MQEFLSLYSKIENPTLEMVLFTFLLAFLLSSIIAITYEKTSPHTIRNPNFLQALILSSLVATTIMQAIGDSVATGLGMLGALAIIRFRTTLRDPRDIVFMFAALGTGIACGVSGFYIAVIGAFGFCLVTVILRFSPFNVGNNVIWELRVRLPEDPEAVAAVEQLLKIYCRYWSQQSIRVVTEATQEKQWEYDYVLIMRREQDRPALLKDLEATPAIPRRFSKQVDMNPFM